MLKYMMCITCTCTTSRSTLMTDTSLLREVGVGQGGTSVEMWPCSIEMLVCKLHVCTETRCGVVTVVWCGVAWHEC